MPSSSSFWPDLFLKLYNVSWVPIVHLSFISASHLSLYLFPSLSLPISFSLPPSPCLSLLSMSLCPALQFCSAPFLTQSSSLKSPPAPRPSSSQLNPYSPLSRDLWGLDQLLSPVPVLLPAPQATSCPENVKIPQALSWGLRKWAGAWERPPKPCCGEPAEPQTPLICLCLTLQFPAINRGCEPIFF